jgi:hypothetical protein
MYELKIIAAPVSSYKVESNGESITMISQAWNSPALLHQVRHVKNLQEGIHVVQACFNQVRQDHPETEFSFSTRAIGRKPNGFDKVRVQLNPSYTNV